MPGVSQKIARAESEKLPPESEPRGESEYLEKDIAWHGKELHVGPKIHGPS